MLKKQKTEYALNIRTTTLGRFFTVQKQKKN